MFLEIKLEQHINAYLIDEMFWNLARGISDKDIIIMIKQEKSQD